ncbi:unnamed protein product [Peniophora sp. CBMAI 1063]|nr:unnamed protein product [Peniophora sp. CBMAI 1063]
MHWNTESPDTRRAYRASSEDSEARGHENIPSSAGRGPPNPSTASSFSSVYGVDYSSTTALLVMDNVLVAMPRESGSIVRVTELSSPVTPVRAEFYTGDETDGATELDEDSLDPELWRALFEGIEPESPTEGN